MKIIHCSDLHLDADLRSRFDQEAARQRRAELLHTFRRLCGYARRSSVGCILICGDLFDTQTPSPAAVRAVEDLICTHKEILFFCLRGNHDEGTALFSSRPQPGNCYLFSDSWTGWELSDPSAGGRRICITGKEPSGGPFSAPDLDPSSLNIVMLHGQVREGTAAPDAESVPLDVLRGRGIDYLALGHLHNYRSFRLDERGTAAYSGCLEGRGFDECGPCGFVLLDTDTQDGRIASRFIPFASRCLYSVPCDVTGCESDAEVYERIGIALTSSQAAEQDLVRLELTGSLEYGCSPDPALVRNEWADCYHYFDYTDSTVPVVHSEDFLCDATLKGEFVRVVSAAEDLDEAMKAKIMRCGLRALSGDSLF